MNGISTHRCYRLNIYKRVPGGEWYGGKAYEGTLDMLLKLLRLRGFPDWAQCEQVTPGFYVIDGGAADLSVIDCVRGAGRQRG